jgi:hypothetical protein
LLGLECEPGCLGFSLPHQVQICLEAHWLLHPERNSPEIRKTMKHISDCHLNLFYILLYDSNIYRVSKL